MSRRTRLRHRLYSITALNAVILFGFTALLTYQALRSHIEVRRLVRTDGGAITELQQLERSHNGWIRRWELANDPTERVALSHRYRTVVGQLTRSETLSHAKFEGVRNAIAAYAARVAAAPTSRDDWRQIAAEGVRVGATIRSVLDATDREFAQRIPDLEDSARDTMYVALGTVYIIAIFSFVVAKQTLAKVVAPIERLAQATEAASQGVLGRRIPIGGDHEVAELTRAFNDMSAKLETMTEALRKEATTDELTGLPNFRTFQKVTDAEVERASRYEQPFGILIFDIDHFKRYNDNYGHAAGNEALKEVAMVIRRVMRTVDTPARYGGEEFVAIIPQTDANGLAGVAERVRAEVEALPVPEGRVGLTISAGGALFPLDGHDRATLFAAADSRLYEAKEGGRNRTVVPHAARVAQATSQAHQR